jgi:hypothetical protein
LIWYLENIFYQSIPAIYNEIYLWLGADADEILQENPILQIGFGLVATAMAMRL